MNNTTTDYFPNMRLFPIWEIAKVTLFRLLMQFIPYKLRAKINLTNYKIECTFVK